MITTPTRSPCRREAYPDYRLVKQPMETIELFKVLFERLRRADRRLR